MAHGNELENIYSKFKAEDTFLKAVPFSTGHIHDTYKIETADSPDHNVTRARAQFRLIENFEENLETMKNIILDIIN